MMSWSRAGELAGALVLALPLAVLAVAASLIALGASITSRRRHGRCSPFSTACRRWRQRWVTSRAQCASMRGKNSKKLKHIRGCTFDAIELSCTCGRLKTADSPRWGGRSGMATPNEGGIRIWRCPLTCASEPSDEHQRELRTASARDGAEGLGRRRPRPSVAAQRRHREHRARREADRREVRRSYRHGDHAKTPRTKSWTNSSGATLKTSGSRERSPTCPPFDFTTPGRPPVPAILRLQIAASSELVRQGADHREPRPWLGSVGIALAVSAVLRHRRRLCPPTPGPMRMVVVHPRASRLAPAARRRCPRCRLGHRRCGPDRTPAPVHGGSSSGLRSLPSPP